MDGKVGGRERILAQSTGEAGAVGRVEQGGNGDAEGGHHGE